MTNSFLIALLRDISDCKPLQKSDNAKYHTAHVNNHWRQSIKAAIAAMGDASTRKDEGVGVPGTEANIAATSPAASHTLKDCPLCGATADVEYHASTQSVYCNNVTCPFHRHEAPTIQQWNARVVTLDGKKGSYQMYFDEIQRLNKQLTEVYSQLDAIKNSKSSEMILPNDEAEKLRKELHYPECWDTMAYPTLFHALNEIASCNDCSPELSLNSRRRELQDSLELADEKLDDALKSYKMLVQRGFYLASPKRESVNHWYPIKTLPLSGKFIVGKLGRKNSVQIVFSQDFPREELYLEFSHWMPIPEVNIIEGGSK